VFIKRRCDVLPVFQSVQRFADLALHGIVYAFVKQVTRSRISAMLTAIYKSAKRPDTYLYLAKRDDFSAVPAALLEMFGSPELVTVLDLARREQLAGADIKKVCADINERGFYLQLPPPQEDLLKAHKAWLASLDGSSSLNQ